MPSRAAALLTLLVLTACAQEVGDNPLLGLDGGPGMDGGVGSGERDAGRFGNSVVPVGSGITDAAFSDPNDTTNNPDAFFINDPLPPYCGPGEDGAPIETPTGTITCPSDKNREGCPCDTEGEQAACWPGKRLNREHGICRDGATECIDSGEFGLRWGPCEGYVLPVEGALAGPDACRCLSDATWTLSNLSPCIYRGDQTWLYSSTLNDNGSLNCGTVNSEPPTAMTGAWSTSSLNADCAGQFRLCFTIKAGDVNNPHDDDCVVAQSCTDVWYAEARVTQQLPDLGAWVTSNSSCAAQFDRSGGYGEMSVFGESVECDSVDDGEGNPYVFYRTNYCPPSCLQTPDAPGCVDCKTGGSGMFGN